MSWVTDVILSMNLEERFDNSGNLIDVSHCVEEINNWLMEKDIGELADLSKSMISGGKTPGSCVFGGAFDHLPIEEFKEYVFSREWIEPDFIQLLLKDQEEMKYTLIEKNA